MGPLGPKGPLRFTACTFSVEAPLFMSRTRKGKKGPGHEYWGKRPVSRNHGAIPGKFSKKRTAKLERLEDKKLEREE